MIRIGILGVDSSHFDLFGEYFSKNAPGFTVSSVWGENPEQAREKIANFTPTAKLSARASETIANSDAILVLPRFPEKHPALASEVLRSGKRVYIDKPIARSKSDFTAELRDPKFRDQWLSFSVCRFYDEIQTAANAQSPSVELIGPLECRDLGDDPRFRDISFYGIHSLEMALEIAGTIAFKERAIERIGDGLRLRLKNSERELTVDFRRELTGEDYQVRYATTLGSRETRIGSTLEIYARAGEKIADFFNGRRTNEFLRDSAEYAVGLLDELREAEKNT